MTSLPASLLLVHSRENLILVFVSKTPFFNRKKSENDTSLLSDYASELTP